MIDKSIAYKVMNGFTLIEILISMVILSIGLLGLGVMQTISMKDNQDSYMHTQAVALVYEMNDSIKANPGEWRKSTLPTPGASCSSGCDSLANACTAAQLAAFDYCNWQKNVARKMIATAKAEVLISPVSGSQCQGAATLRCIKISWSPNHQTTANSNSSFELEMSP